MPPRSRLWSKSRLRSGALCSPNLAAPSLSLLSFHDTPSAPLICSLPTRYCSKALSSFPLPISSPPLLHIRIFNNFHFKLYARTRTVWVLWWVCYSGPQPPAVAQKLAKNWQQVGSLTRLSLKNLLNAKLMDGPLTAASHLAKLAPSCSPPTAFNPAAATRQK